MGKNAYFWASAVGLLLFLFVVWQLRKDTETALDQYINATTRSIALGNITIVSGLIDGYSQEIQWLAMALENSENKEFNTEIIHRFQEKDTLVSEIGIEKNSLQHPSLFLISEGEPTLCFSTPMNGKDNLLLKIPLRRLHEKIASDKNLMQAYTTVTLADRYLFHPDEKQLGKEENTTDKALQIKAFSEEKTLMTDVYSDYLQMDVSRFYAKKTIHGQGVVFTANVPNLGMKEHTQNTLNAFTLIFLCGILVFSGIILLGFWRWRREFILRKEAEHQNMALQLKNEKQKQIVTAARLDLLKSGLNPHFLFNSLGSLVALTDSQPALAKEFSMKLSSVYHYLLKHENHEKTSLNEEINFTNDYVKLQKIRFANAIKLKVSLSGDALQAAIPPVSVQLLVENGIKHTAFSAVNPLEISISEENGYIVVTNPYRPRQSEIQQSGKGIGNLQKRYSLLTDKPCFFSVENGKYIAKIPLL